MCDVAIARCDSYEMEEAQRALREVLEPIGGLDWVKKGMRVAIKANLVAAMKPEAAATTHPVMLCALSRELRARGAEVVVGDSPGGLYNAAFLNRVYAAAGLKPLEQEGVRLNQDFSEEEVFCPQAKALRSFRMTGYLHRCDAVISFCKLKSHGMMGMSASVKNLFGVIPGTLKPEYHYRFPQESDFADMLIDLNEYLRPRLCLADAVTAMEGNGPTMGRPRQVGALLASKSPYALDLACARLIGQDARGVPTLMQAFRRGLAPESVDALQVSGPLEELCVKDFDNIRSHHGIHFEGDGSALSRLRGRLIRTAMGSRPGLVPKKCVGCGQCAQICPAHAIEMRQGRPVIARAQCIRCFCCQEFCPRGALIVHRPLAARLLHRS